MDITTVIVVAVMAIVLIVMLVCKKSMATSPMLQPILFLCVALELGGVIYVIYNNLSGGSGTKSIIKGQMAFYHSRGAIAGDFLKKLAPGKKILLIPNPGWETSRMDGSLIEALKKTYGDTIEIDTIVVPPNAEEQGIMISELMTNKALDAIIDKHPDAGIVAFLYGLPENPQRMKIFSKKGTEIFLFEMGSAEGKWLSKKIADGTISGVIVAKRGVKHTEPPKGNDKDTFDVRYILVTKDNLDANRERIE